MDRTGLPEGGAWRLTAQSADLSAEVGLVSEARVGGQLGERGPSRAPAVSRGPVHTGDTAQQRGGKATLVEAATVHLPGRQTDVAGDLEDRGVGEYQLGEGRGDLIGGPGSVNSRERRRDQQLHPLGIVASPEHARLSAATDGPGIRTSRVEDVPMFVPSACGADRMDT